MILDCHRASLSRRRTSGVTLDKNGGGTIQNHGMERRGINAVERIVLNEMGWIFREQPISDYGIDAHLEVCESAGPTGRLIAMQIKSGESWFRAETQDGWNYTGLHRHLYYWMSHSLPVILVLYHPTLDNVWWVPIEEHRVVVLNQGWKITVPRDFRFDQSSAAMLRSLAIPDFRRRRDVRTVLGLTKSIAPVSNVSVLVEALNAAQATIDIVSPYIDTEMYWVLKTLAHRVRLRLIIGPYTTAGVVDDLTHWQHEAPNMETRMIPDANGQGFHSKFMLIDNAVAIYGSANLTKYSWRHSMERVLADDTAATVLEFQREFESLWILGVSDTERQHLFRLIGDRPALEP